MQCHGLTFDLPVVTLTLKLCLGHIAATVRCRKLICWMGHWLESAGVLNHCVTFNLGSAKECSPAWYLKHVSFVTKIYGLL